MSTAHPERHEVVPSFQVSNGSRLETTRYYSAGRPLATSRCSVLLPATPVSHCAAVYSVQDRTYTRQARRSDEAVSWLFPLTARSTLFRLRILVLVRSVCAMEVRVRSNTLGARSPRKAGVCSWISFVVPTCSWTSARLVGVQGKERRYWFFFFFLQ